METNALEKKDGVLGAIRIADEVVSIIAGLAATEIDGIAGMSGGLVGGIAEMLGKKNFSKGVKVEVIISESNMVMVTGLAMVICPSSLFVQARE